MKRNFSRVPSSDSWNNIHYTVPTFLRWLYIGSEIIYSGFKIALTFAFKQTKVSNSLQVVHIAYILPQEATTAEYVVLVVYDLLAIYFLWPPHSTIPCKPFVDLVYLGVPEV